jgi:hypothetical protein
MNAEQIEVEGERILYTHAHLHHAADMALDQAIKTEEGSFYNCLYSIVMIAFCFEAYANYIGMEYLGDWDEKVSPLDKLKVVAKKAGIEVNYGKRPFQSMKTANKFRNELAHGKTARLSSSYLRKLRSKSKIKNLSTWWESVCTTNCTKQLLDDLEAIIEMIDRGYDLKLPSTGLLSFETHHTKLK